MCVCVCVCVVVCYVLSGSEIFGCRCAGLLSARIHDHFIRMIMMMTVLA